LGSGRRNHLARVGNVVAIVSLAVAVVLLLLWLDAVLGGSRQVSSLGPRGFEIAVTPTSISMWTYRGFPTAQPFISSRGRASHRYEYDSARYAYSGEGSTSTLHFFTVDVYRGATYFRRRPGVRDADATGASSNSFVADWSLVVVPMWLPLSVAAVFPLYWRIVPLGRARRHAKRQRLGLCVACGYDLRGGGGGRCPECGTAIADEPGTTPHAARPA
jgi:hypothetical protein